MYNSGLSDWTVVKMGPRRDVYGDLAKEVRSEGMYFGASSHRIEHDWFMDGIHKQPTEASDPKLQISMGQHIMQLKIMMR